MANANSPYEAKASAPLGNATALTVFTRVLNPLSNIAVNQTPESAWIKYHCWAIDAPLESGYGNNINAVNFAIRASGRATGGGTTNFTPSLQFGRSATAASNTTIASLTPFAVNSTSGHWVLNANLLWDPISGQISGSFSGYAGAGGTVSLTALAAITPVTGQTVASPATSVSGAYSTGEFVPFFSVAGLFSASFAGNTAFLDNFAPEEL